MRNRMYDPNLGRFTQTDSILGNRPTMGYAYARNNPLSRKDPWGLQDADGVQSLPRPRHLGDDDPEIQGSLTYVPTPPNALEFGAAAAVGAARAAIVGTFEFGYYNIGAPIWDCLAKNLLGVDWYSSDAAEGAGRWNDFGAFLIQPFSKTVDDMADKAVDSYLAAEKGDYRPAASFGEDMMGKYMLVKGADELTDRAIDKVRKGVDRSKCQTSTCPKPNQAVINKMNTMKLPDWLDCKEIAERLQDAAGGDGEIINVKPPPGGLVTLFENGVLWSDNLYHQVFTDGNFVYDPRFSPTPVPLSTWKAMIRNLNPKATFELIKPPVLTRP